MLNQEAIQSMKQTNISVDPEKSKQRVKELWKASSKEDRDAILSLSGITQSAIYNIYNSGSVSAKLAVALAQTLSINPFYLTGQTDERGEYTDDLLKEILTALGYVNLLAVKTAKKPRRNAAVQPEINAPIPDAEVAAPAPNPKPAAAIVTEAEPPAASPELTEDDMILLLRSLLLRAKAGVPGVAECVEGIKVLLLS